MHRVLNIRDNTNAIVSENETIFEAFERCGLKLPHGCLSGSCGTCVIEVISGENNLREMGIIEADTISSIKQNSVTLQNKNLRLSCRAKVLKGEISFRPIHSKN
jgi:ferredoxin